MTVPVVFRNQGERVITSFDYTDIADGTGIIDYQGFSCETSGGVTYKLNRQATYSSQIETTQALTAINTYQKEMDLDFDLTTFNLPQTLRGKAIIQFAWGHDAYTGGNTNNAYIIAKLRKWDGTTETEIAHIQTETLDITNGVTKYRIANMPITIPQTLYKKGETLRLTIEGWALTNGGGSNLTIGHDPQNREGNVLTAANDMITKMDLYTPFDIKL